jgi:hypothetical protein
MLNAAHNMNPKQIRLSKKPRSIQKMDITENAPLWVSEFMRWLWFIWVS